MHICMRTTLDLDDELLAAARRRASEQGITLTALVEEALTAVLAPRPLEAEQFRLQWTPHHGATLGGFDVADRDSLYDAMERRP